MADRVVVGFLVVLGVVLGVGILTGRRNRVSVDSRLHDGWKVQSYLLSSTNGSRWKGLRCEVLSLKMVEELCGSRLAVLRIRRAE